MYDEFVDINCFSCDRELHDIKYIFVGNDDDRYYCYRCSRERSIDCTRLYDTLEGLSG